jgi:hypothetical protein
LQGGTETLPESAPKDPSPPPLSLHYNRASSSRRPEGWTMRDAQRRFDEVLDALERERQRFDEDLKRLIVAAA